MSDSEYVHPVSGRVYREGDPAHRFARLAAGLANECREFLRHYDNRFSGADYYEQHLGWPGDPGRIARSMGSTLDALDEAYTEVVTDRDLFQYGLGQQDEEWQRKYGEVEEI